MREKAHTRIEKLAKLALVATAVIWGGGFIAVQLALDAQLSSSAIMFGRFGTGAALIFAVFFKDIIRGLRRGQLLSGIATGLFLFGGFMAQTLGQKYSTPSNTALITASYVVIVPFLWWAVSKRRPPGILFAASLLCLLGVSLLSVDLSGGFSLRAGDLLTLLAAFLFACQITATGVLAPQMDFRVLVFLQLTVAAVCSLAVFLATDGDFSVYAHPGGGAAVLYLGALSTCLCYILQTTAQKHVNSSAVAIILSTESLFGAFFSVLAGYDKLTLKLVAGGLILFLSVILPDMLRKRDEVANNEYEK